MRRPFLLLVAAVLLCLVHGCSDDRRYVDFSKPTPAGVQGGDKAAAGQRPLRLAVASVSSPGETVNSLRTIAEALSRRTGRQIVLVQRKTYAEVNLLLANDDADIAFVSTGAYSAYRGQAPIEVLVMTEFMGSATYDAQLIVPRDSPAQSLEDLQGKVFAFTDPLSFSGHMAVMDALLRLGSAPERHFGRYFYTASHDRAIQAVANRIADGASIDNQILDVAIRKQPELAGKVRVVATLGVNPSGPVVVAAGLDPKLKDALRDIFLDLHQDPAQAEALETLAISRFTPPVPGAYDALRALYDRIGGFL
ncbi:MAG: phosphate/phosphite/phosphonate ABC transporter, periplasmic binding protein [Solidesulfovibrio magneticus str. Maddingley MBC34]|uniref:Phosphate/phosphite/phosphonate ABC transporter, periplasmic binding protein n=1 Tax=Solidesulfovibrio magneticus str. Maddingley MBC34 TaxID=1206767 RepID=K6GS16_9BACT|nr:MAG: phosphate/phosphite/phosphonate ABC transporter, periplasmic binding protein [Solidesulfovibrio magneticus str. Maddingley MBC34]